MERRNVAIDVIKKSQELDGLAIDHLLGMYDERDPKVIAALDKLYTATVHLRVTLIRKESLKREEITREKTQ